ncbi:MAG: sugar phosphate isomerase/epimerase family protein [Planctomycetota bacterium]
MQRRNFLGQSAVATSLLVGGTACRSWGLPSAVAASALNTATRLEGVQLAIATICTDGFANRHHEPAMQVIPETGFKNVELNLWYPDQITPSYIAKLKDRCADAEINPISVQGTGFGADGRHAVMKDYSHKLLMMQYAKQLGCKIVKFTGAKRGTQGGLDSIIQVCKELAPAAEEMGILLTLENHSGNNLETLEDYEQIFEAIDSPNVGLCLDTGHFEGSGIRLDEVLKRLHSRTLHVDLKDCAAFGKGHNTVRFGDGVTDFDNFLSKLMEVEYQGYLVVEQAWAEPKGDWKRDLNAAYQRFKKWETS